MTVADGDDVVLATDAARNDPQLDIGRRRQMLDQAVGDGGEALRRAGWRQILAHVKASYGRPVGSIRAPTVFRTLVADIEYFFDPVCPFAWQTSRWMRRVAEHRSFTVDWRFISLRILNEGRDYERDFPAGYVDGHTRGLELLRVAAAARVEGGNDAVARLYAAYGDVLWDSPDGLTTALRIRGEVASVEAVLASADLDPGLANAAGDEHHDVVIRAETGDALARVGDDVGTPIITYLPPDGLSFFGPVLSVLPDDEESVAVWDAFTTLAKVRGFAELKRSMRDPLDLGAFAGR